MSNLSSKDTYIRRHPPDRFTDSKGIVRHPCATIKDLDTGHTIHLVDENGYYSVYKDFRDDRRFEYNGCIGPSLLRLLKKLSPPKSKG